MPVPIARDSTPVPVSVMDCIRRGGGEQTLMLDDQRYKSIGRLTTSLTDGKLLWKQDLIPFRTITAVGSIRFGDSSLLFSSIMGQLGEASFENKDVTEDGVTFTSPQWGKDYFTPSLILGLGVLQLGNFESNTGFLWSGYQYTGEGGTFILAGQPDNLEKYLLIGGVLTQIVCPKPWKPIKYELWTVTTRWGIPDPGDPDGKGFGVVPLPFPWSSSTDFQKQTSGTLNPGQTLIIPCPTSMKPSAPAPQSFAYPAVTIPMLSGWGVSQFIVFPG